MASVKNLTYAHSSTLRGNYLVLENKHQTSYSPTVILMEALKFLMYININFF